MAPLLEDEVFSLVVDDMELLLRDEVLLVVIGDVEVLLVDVELVVGAEVVVRGLLLVVSEVASPESGCAVD